jgi:hypothetical protein
VHCSTPQLLAHLFTRALVLGAVAWPAACAPPDAIYDLASAGGGATTGSGGASTSTGSCNGTSGTGGCGQGSIAAVTGDFNNPADWVGYAGTGTTVSPQQGQCVMTTDGSPGQYTGCGSIANVRASGCQAFVHVTPATVPGPYTTTFGLDGASSGNSIEMIKVGDVLQMQITTNGTTSPPQFANYDPVAHAWWQIREAGGVLHFETSSDAKCWTQQAQIATPAFAGVVSFNLGLGVPGGNSKLPMDTATFDHLNASP